MGLGGFLENYKTSKSSDATHTSMQGGKWNIPRSKAKHLYKLIINAHNKG